MAKSKDSENTTYVDFGRFYSSVRRKIRHNKKEKIAFKPWASFFIYIIFKILQLLHKNVN